VTSPGKPGEGKEKTKAEFDRLVAQGKDALAAKKPAEAVRAFQAALLLMPGEEAVTGLADARAALDKDDREKQRLANYRAHMDAGKAALVAQRFPDAQREFIAAQGFIPGDDAAIKGQRQAEDELKNIQDREKRKAAFKDQLDRARAALRAGRFDEAVAAANQALHLFPNDPEAKQVQRDAKLAWATARSQYDDLMTRANAALQLQGFEEAIRLYAEALRLFPGDDAATLASQQASQMALALVARQAAYNRSMDAGAQALRDRRFGDAVTEFREALRLVPNDPAAARGLRDAQAGEPKLREEQDPRAGNDAPKARRAKCDQAIADGKAALNAKKFDDAIKDFEDALREVPNDPTAMANLRLAEAMKRAADLREAQDTKAQDPKKPAKPDKPGQKGPNP
jgi:tetratricopeptide (TPR) repeat protein